MSKKLTNEEFIKKANEKHGNKYDYSKVEYEGALTKVCIICPEHGHDDFWQQPSQHLSGHGCPKCANEANGNNKRFSNEEFIKKAREKHGDKYDYTNVEYKDSQIKVCIICPYHGEFWQQPSQHLSGSGCPKCKSEAIGERCRLSKEDFIKKAREKHGDKYDYINVEYKDSKTKVFIICPNHGDFCQLPAYHTQGNGCPKCANETKAERFRSSKEEFIKKANEKHEGKYDYSKVKYVNDRIKVCIICNKHDEFWQTPGNHTRGAGCPKCKGEANGERCRLSREEIIKKANKIHHNKYKYSKVNYYDTKTKVCIICKKHGEFWQLPSHHTQGVGCPKCSGVYSPTTEEWIASAREIHNDKYGYNKVKYVDAFTKVCIICHKHGEFWQLPPSHMQGNGCPKCNLSHLERDVMNYLDEHGVNYDYQKRFDWLGKQSLDFYLPDYNVGIECQGEQHFFPVDFAGKGVEWACKHFDKLVSRDKKKKELCEENGVKLLYFGKVPNYDTFLGEVIHDDAQHLIDYLKEYNN